MRKSKLQAANLAGDADEVEAAFYEAMRCADIDRLMACWADEDDIICVHPAGPRVVGAGAIRATFEAIFANGPVRVWPQGLRKTVSVGSAMHSLLERVEVMSKSGRTDAWVIATNVYHKTAQGWRMVAHHASPGTSSEPQEIVETPAILH